MPPVAKAGGQQFRKDVPFVTKDDAEQVAAGIVMVPDKADLQNDFAREETIREFADQFGTFVEAGEAGGGVMHAVFPDEWMDLERNEVLNESEEIGGETVDAGAWVQEWAINHDDLWELIADGVLEGYSIGAIQVDWNGPFEPDEVEDVDTSELPDDELVWELVEGLIREVSAVDIPAVPDAEILETKADAEKRLGDYLGDPNGFIEEALERGHSEEDAQQMWDVLSEAAEVDGAREPGEKSLFHRIGKAAVDTFLGDPEPAGPNSNPDPTFATDKQGQTLSQSNRDSAMAAVDANLDMLEDAGVDHGLTRFTDQEGVDFDLSEHDAREWSSGGDGDGDGDGDSGQTPNYAAGGDTPADDPNSTTMSDDPMADAPDWAKALHDDIQENSQRIDEALERQRPKTAEIQIDGETYEVRADAAKAALGVGEDVDVEEAIERLNEKASRVDEVEQRLDTLSQQSGVSTQLDAARTGDGDGNGEEDALSDLGKALS